VYVDEAQEYFDDSIETILNQARKYHVGLTLAHQTLDQLSPRLRSAILANTSMKCAGGVSAKDARSLADELRTTSDFIEGMKRRGPRTEFALWVKHLTGQAVRLSVPLGFLEKQPTLDDDEYEQLLERNRAAYCGTLADVGTLLPSPPVQLPPPQQDARPSPTREEINTQVPARPTPKPPPPAEILISPAPEPRPDPKPAWTDRSAVQDRELGKGGKNHRYLQAMAKELAEQGGLRATIEAPLPSGNGLVDVLLERDGVVAAIEISVSTPAEHEKANLRKCLDAGYPRIGVVLAKSKRTQTTYRTTLTAGLTGEEQGRVSFLSPEDLPDFIAALAPPPAPTERVVKGYKVKGTITVSSPEEAKARQDAIAKLIAKSLSS
jgi:hypothetical protein